jgi:hypothetical protein
MATHPKLDLDETTVHILKKVLAMPPKHHDAIKVGRAAKKPKTKHAKRGSGKSAKPCPR